VSGESTMKMANSSGHNTSADTRTIDPSDLNKSASFLARSLGANKQNTAKSNSVPL